MNRMRHQVFRYRSVSVATIAFQACSFNHSDISPFRINNLRTRNEQDLSIVISPPRSPRSLTGFSSIAAALLLPQRNDRRASILLNRNVETASKSACERFAKPRSAFRPSRFSSQILAFQPLPRTTGLAAVGSRDPVLVAGRDGFRDSVYIGLSNWRLHLFGDRAADDHVGHPKLLTPRLDICGAYCYQEVVHQVFHT